MISYKIQDGKQIFMCTYIDIKQRHTHTHIR